MEDKYTFECDYFDQQASLLRRYSLTYYTKDNTLSIYDTRNKRLFLKRTEYPTVTLDKIYIGATVTVYSRQLKVMEYSDEFTRRYFEAKKESTLALIKPDAYNHMGKIIQIILANGFTIANLQMIKMDKDMAAAQYAEHEGKPFYDNLVNFMTSDVVVAMELIGKDAIKRWRTLMGPTNTQKAKEEAPQSIRALFGTDGTKNATHGSDSPESAAREIGIFFGKKAPTTAIFNNCTCCCIRPHAMKDAGNILDRIIAEGFEISAMKNFNLPKNIIEEFLEVYRGILPEYHGMVEEMSSGPFLVLEIRQEDAVESFRKLVGPIDPEIAQHLRPDTLRAAYGVNRVENGMHCTDLPEDGVLEVEYFFNILYNKS